MTLVLQKNKYACSIHMMMSSNGNIFRLTGHMCGEFTGPRLMNYPHKVQWRGALMFSLIYVWINGWVNNREASDLRRYCAHYDVTVMKWFLNNFCTLAVEIHPQGRREHVFTEPITRQIWLLQDRTWWSWDGDTFRITGTFWREATGYWWNPLRKG